MMRFLFGGKRRGLNFAALDGDTDSQADDDNGDNDSKTLGYYDRDFNVTNRTTKKVATDIAREENTSASSWMNDGSSSVGSSRDLNVTASSHYTAESFHTAKSKSTKKNKKREKQLAYTKTLNKPLKSKVSRDMETNTSFAQIESSVVSGVTTDTAKKKKRFKQLFSAFKRKTKGNEEVSRNDQPTEVKVSVHQQVESSAHSKKDETVDYSENVFAMDVSSMDADDSGFLSVGTSKEWNLMSNPPQDFYSFDNEDISEMLANVPSHDTATDIWTPSEHISFDQRVDDGHISSEVKKPVNTWDFESASYDKKSSNLPISSGHVDSFIKPWSTEPRSSRSIYTNPTEGTSSSFLLPEITDDNYDDKKIAKSSVFDSGFGQRYIRTSDSLGSSVYTSSENDSDSSSSSELDFSSDSRLHQSSSSRITLGIMAQISGLVDRSTLTSNTGETTQYGTAYTYELDDTFDSQDDDEIAKALLHSVDSNDLAIVPDIEVINGHINHTTPQKEDESLFQTNVSEIDIFGMDTSADISSLMDSDQSLFRSHDSGIKDQSHSLEEIEHAPHSPIDAFDTAKYDDLHSMNYDQGMPSTFDNRMTSIRQETKLNDRMQAYMNTAEAIQPNVDWPETPIKKAPSTPIRKGGGLSPNGNGSTLDDNLETSFSSMHSSPGTQIRNSKAVSPRISLHHDLLLKQKTTAPISSSSSSTRPFFWRSHPTGGNEKDVTSPAPMKQQRFDKSRVGREAPSNKILPSIYKREVESKNKQYVPSSTTTTTTTTAAATTTTTTTTTTAKEKGMEPSSSGSIAWKKALFESKSKMNVSASITKAQTFVSSIKQNPFFERESISYNPKTPPFSKYKKKNETHAATSVSPNIPNVVVSTPDSVETTSGTFGFKKPNGIPSFIEQKPMSDDAISGCSNSIADKILAFESISKRSKPERWTNASSPSSSSPRLAKNPMPLNSSTLSKLKTMGKNMGGLWN